MFYTSPHYLAGYEEAFPDPDNLQKMKRSIENAETVGLFIPTRPARRGRANLPARPTVVGRAGFYAPPAKVTMPATMAVPRRVATLNPSYARTRADENTILLTPPPTPIGQGTVKSRTVVPLNTTQDAFTDFRTIRAARYTSLSFDCETHPHTTSSDEALANVLSHRIVRS